MSKRLAVFVTAVMCIAVLSAQRVDRTVAHSIAEYFNEYTSDRCVTKFANLDRRRNNIIVNKKTEEITPVTVRQRIRQSAAEIFSFFILKNPFLGFSKKVFAHTAEFTRKNYCFLRHIAPKLDFFIFMW